MQDALRNAAVCLFHSAHAIFLGMKTSSQRRLRPLFVGLTLLMLAFWFLLRVSGSVYLHHDEELKYRFTADTLSGSLRYVTEQDVFPPLWFTLFWLWNALTGISEFTGRFLAICFSMVTLAGVMRLGRAWTKQHFPGWIAAALLCTGALFAYHSVEISPYALGMLLATGSMAALLRWHQTQKRMWGLAWAGFAAAMLYTHYYLGFVLMVQAVWLVWQLVRDRRALPVRQLAGSAATFALLWGPWLPAMLHQINSLRRATTEAGQAYGTTLGSAYNQIFTTPAEIIELINTTTNGLWPVYVVLIALGLWAMRRRPSSGLITLWAFGIPALSLLLNLIMAVYAPRYVATATVGLALLAGAGLSVLPRRLGVLAGIALVIAQAAQVMTYLPTPQRIPYRDIYLVISRDLQPGDVIAYVGADPEDRVIAWNERQYLRGDVPRLVEPAAGDLLGYRRIWFMTGRLLDADVQARFQEIEPSHPLETVLGDCVRQWCFVAQLLQAPPLAVPEIFGGVMPFYGGQVSLSEADTLNTRLYWRTDSPPLEDYSIAVHILDADGRLIGQSDGPLSHFGNVIQTSRMVSDMIYQDRRSIETEGELKPGCCDIRLIVYQPWDGERLLLPDGRDGITLAENFP